MNTHSAGDLIFLDISGEVFPADKTEGQTHKPFFR